MDALLSPLSLLEGLAADLSFVVALSTDESGAAVSGKTRVSVVTSTAGAAVGANYCGPSDRGNIGIPIRSD